MDYYAAACQDPPHKASILPLPIFDGTPPLPDDECLLSLEDEVITVEEGMEFLERASQSSWTIRPTDPDLLAVWACSLVVEAWKVIGREGLLGMVSYLDEFESRITLDGIEPSETIAGLAEAREARG